MNRSFNLLHEGIFEKNDIRMSYSPVSQKYSAEIREFISEAWKKSSNSSTKLFDGNLINLDSYQIRNNILELKVSDITYKEFFVIRNDSFTKRFGNGFRSNPLSVGAIIETSDNMIMLGKRRNELDYAPGYYGTLAGVMDKDLDCTNEKPDPFKTLLRELMEEKSIDEDDIQEIKCVGLVYNITFKQTYLPFFVHLKINSKTVLEKGMIEKEFTDFITIPSIQKSVQSFLDAHSGNISGTCLANLKTWSKIIKGWTRLKT